MDDFWSTLRSGNLTVVRDKIDTADSTGVTLLSGKRVDADYVLYATGWGDHFSFFSPELKDELGIPHYSHEGSKSTTSVTMADSKKPSAVDKSLGKESEFLWASRDKAADELVARKLPLLGAGPKDFNGWQIPAARQKAVKVRRWRLYNRIVPLDSHGRSSSNNIAILGQIHTTQTPTIAEIQGLWAAAYLLDELPLPGEPAMVSEVAEWNAWTRKRYASVGERYPYALFDWVPYLDCLVRDLGLNTKRYAVSGSSRVPLLADFFLPYGPHCYSGIVDEYLAVRKKAKFGVGNAPDHSSASSVSV